MFGLNNHGQSSLAEHLNQNVVDADLGLNHTVVKVMKKDANRLDYK